MASEKTHGLLFKQSGLDKSYKLLTPAASERGTTAFMTYVNGEILKVGRPITLVIPNTPLKFENVYGINRVYDKQVGDPDLMTKPRADVAIVALVGGKFKEVCYLAYDWVTSPSDIPYYSILNFRADAGKIGVISKDSTVVDFLQRIADRLDKVVKEKKSFYMLVKDTKLIGRGAFGPLYKRETKKSKDNVDGRAEGKIVKLSKAADAYLLRFSVGLRLNDRDLKVYISDSKRKAVLSAEPMSSARFKVNGKEYKGVRVLLKPMAAVDPKAEELSASK
jgi:hypothetical protein